ncbi:MAG: RDD family protein [Deltaproteobacteria bacterium]|nr:RDD family protein [Deltaproteobacteria bacterium]
MPRLRNEPATDNPYAPPAAEAPNRRQRRKRRLRDAPGGKRFGNFLIDTLVAYGLAFAAAFMLAAVGEWRLINLAVYTVFPLYYLVAETLFGRTVGKLLTGTEVVTTDGSPPTFGAVFLRTLVRYVPFEPFSFLGTENGWHDRWSHTRVVLVPGQRE